MEPHINWIQLYFIEINIINYTATTTTIINIIIIILNKYY